MVGWFFPVNKVQRSYTKFCNIPLLLSFKLLFHWLNSICFLLSNLIWQDAISFHLLSRVNQGDWLLFEKLNGKYLLKRKRQPVRVIFANSCILKEAATADYSWKKMFLIFISTEVVKKAKYIYGLQLLISLKIKLLHWCFFFFLFCWNFKEQSSRNTL